MLLLTWLWSGTAAAHFGPEPDDAQVAQARQAMIDRREALGDEAFATEAIANLELILTALPYNHPRYEALTQQPGTGEHFLANNAFYLRHSAEQLADINDARALQPLWECVRLFAQSASGRTQTRYNVEAAWLVLAESEMSRTAALVKLLMQGASTHGIALYLDHAKPEPPDVLFPLPGESTQDDALIRLAKLPDSSKRPSIGLRAIERIAEGRQWRLPEDAARAYLEDQDPRVRLGAASILYIQNAYDQRKPEAEQPQASPENQRAVDSLRSVWRGLLDERKALHIADPLEIRGSMFTHQQKLKRNQRLLMHLVRLTAFLSIDQRMVDLLIQTVPYEQSAPTWLARAHTLGRLKLSDQQRERMTAMLADPWARDDTRYAIAAALIRMDHRPAADAILEQLNAMRLLDGLSLHPQTVVGDKPQVPATYLSWLKRHRTPAQP